VADTRRNLVVIENGTLAGLAGSAKALAEFPFLSALAGKGGKKAGCTPCSRKTAAADAGFDAAKKTIAGLASEKKRRLKELLNAKSARVTYRNPQGRLVQVTF
jgi:hypothetical protein